ncbi:MAG: site-2 protease family protein [Clostridiales Family XIII bacterium]|jgi:Zn-dependent protease|nr:site-2 protease family protein [Clostridiales Family XIII bacterium]
MLGYASISQFLYTLLITLPGIILGLTVHEFAHAFSAYKLGDMTAKRMGRVTLNPIAHIDAIGLVALILVHFGWGKPVPVNPYAFTRYRRLKNFVVDIAGVTMNFIVSFCLVAVYIALFPSTGGTGWGMDILDYAIQINAVLMVFNLIPIPPLDGFGILTEIFGWRGKPWYPGLYRNGGFILMAVILIGAFADISILGYILTPARTAIVDFMYNFWLPIFGYTA